MSDSDISLDSAEDPCETEAAHHLSRLNDLLDDFNVDNAGFEGDTIASNLKGLSDLVLKYVTEYNSLEPDLYDVRHIERIKPDHPLTKIVKKIEGDPELIEKIIELVIMGGNDEDSQAAAHYIALALPWLDFEEMDFEFNEMVGFAEFLFDRVKTLSKTNREMPMFCLVILTRLLDGSKQNALTYRGRIRELVSPLMKRCYELYTCLMRRLRKTSHVGELMSDSPLPKRSRQPTAAHQSATKPAPGPLQTVGTPSSATRVTSTAISGDSVPSTPTLPASRSRPTTSDRTLSEVTASSQESDAALPSLEPLLRGIPPALSDGLVVPQVTATESSTEDRPYHDCALSPMTDAMEMRVITVAMAGVGHISEIQSILLPYALKMQMVGCLVNLSALYAKRKQWQLVVDALKLVSRLVAHKKFALELVANGGVGVQLLLTIPASSPAATAVMSVFSSLAENNRDTMERVYLILQSNSNTLLDKLVGYCVHVMECGYSTARTASGHFLCHSFVWPPVKDCFDKYDGLRKLLNQIMTLSLMSNSDGDAVDDETQLAERQRVRDTLLTLQSYFMVNFSVITRHIVSTICSRLPNSTSIQDDMRKQLLEQADKLRGAVYNTKLTLDNLCTLALYWPALTKWACTRSFMSLGGVQLLLQITVMASGWKNNPCRVDTILNALECLAMLALLQSDVRIALCETFLMPNGERVAAMNTLLEVAEGTLLDDISAQNLALQIICACVCPEQVADQLLLVSGHDQSVRCGESYARSLPRVWACVRTHQGIRVLVRLIQKRSTAVAGADGVRSLACFALCGLSRCSEVQQILSKLPLFNSGQMSALTAEPLAHDRTSDHRIFCQYARILINNVTGKRATGNGDATLSAVQKAYVVGQTKITFPREELLQVIHQHLLDEGLPAAAMALQIEAKLASSSSSVPPTPKTPLLPTLPPPQPLSIATATAAPPAVSAAAVQASPTPCLASNGTTCIVARSISPAGLSKKLKNPGPPTPKSRIPIASASPIVRPTVSSLSKGAGSLTPLSQRLGESRRKEIVSLSMPPPVAAPKAKEESKLSLSKIVTHFLRDQHSKCAHPMSDCPPFSLSHGHQCPMPRYRRHAPASLARRVMQRQVFGRRGNVGINAHYYDRQLIYSRYRPSLTFEHPLDSFYSAVAFLPGDQQVVLGCQSGEICLASVSNDRSVARMVSDFELRRHNTRISSLVPSKSGRLLLSSACDNVTEQTILYSVGDPQFGFQYHVSDALTAEFANLTEDRFIACHTARAKIYDTETGVATKVLEGQSDNHNTGFCYATFHPNDDLVLSDGVLWDIRQPQCKVVRRFDSLNLDGMGLFHPKTGMEVIVNSGIWDLRTYNLLTTCPQLDKCLLRFNHAGNVLFGVHQTDTEDSKDGPESALQVVDGVNYKPIATVPMKKQLFDFNISYDDSCLAVVDNYSDSDWINSGSDCRLYLVGQQRHWLNDADNDEDESGSEDDDDDTDSDDDSIGTDDSDVDNLSNDDFMFTSDEDGEDDEEGEDGDEDEDEEEDEDMSDDEGSDSDSSSSDSNSDSPNVVANENHGGHSDNAFGINFAAGVQGVMEAIENDTASVAMLEAIIRSHGAGLFNSRANGPGGANGGGTGNSAGRRSSRRQR